MRFEGESAGDATTQEPAPPVQENLGSEAETVSGDATQEPTPPTQMNVEPLGETGAEVNTTPQEIVSIARQKENLEEA